MNSPNTPLFASYLGTSLAALPPSVRAGHAVDAVLHMAGRASVARGASLWARIIAGVFRFPPADADVAVTVTMTQKDGGELWERRFDGRPFWSFLKVRKGVMTEKFGPLTFQIGLHAADGQLHYPVKAGRMGPIPLPKIFLPISIAREFEQDGRFHFDVALHAPLTGAPMVHYQGWLEPADPPKMSIVAAAGPP